MMTNNKGYIRTIQNLKDLDEFVSADLLANNLDRNDMRRNRRLRTESYYISKYLKMLRMEEYFYNTGKHYLGMLYERTKNSLGVRIGLKIFRNTCEKGLAIRHCPVVINKRAAIGKNCQLTGNNCIGSVISGEAPVLKDEVVLGYGAVVLGKIEIAQKVTVGAGAVVTKSVLKEGSTVAGVPAVLIR